MNSLNIAALGLGSGGCLFLRDLPTDRSLIGKRIAVDTDAKVLRGLGPSEVDARLHITLPPRFRKKPLPQAETQLGEALVLAGQDLQGILPPPGTLLLVAVALGGLAGSGMAAHWLPQLNLLGYRLVSLVLMPAPYTPAAQRAEVLLPQIARQSLSLCVVNPQSLALALPGSLPVQRLFALTSVLRVGHALDWQRLSEILTPIEVAPACAGLTMA